MRIAIPTNDKITIFKRTGRADAFLIFEIDQVSVKEVDYRKNLHNHDDHEHSEDHHNHSHDELVETLSDCSFVLVNVIGKNLLADLTNSGIIVFKTKEKNIKNAIADFNTSRNIGEGE